MKKIISMVLVLVLALTAIGGTLAYFTDTDTATNEFTVGNVKIDLHEHDTSTWNDEFTDNQVLMPSKEGKDGNAIAKHVLVENTGANAAWVWVDMKIPAALVNIPKNADGSYNIAGYNASYDELHANYYGEFSVNYHGQGYAQTAIDEGYITGAGAVTNEKMVAVADGLWNEFKLIEVENINGVDWAVFRTTMEKTLPSGMVSLPCLRQVYMDYRVTAAPNGYYLLDGEGNVSTEIYTGEWDIIVDAYAIQADGIDSIENAIAAYGGADAS